MLNEKKFMTVNIKNSKEAFFESIKGKKLVLFGASSLAMKCLNSFLRGVEVSYICDNDERIQGTKLFNINIVSPNVLASEEVNRVIILNATTMSAKQVNDQINSIGDFVTFSGVILISHHASGFASELYDNKDKLEKVYEMLYDDVSKYVFDEMLYRYMAEFIPHSCGDLIVAGQQYIIKEMFQNYIQSEEIIIDCGAATGHTLQTFAAFFGEQLRKIYAFEPTSETFKVLKTTVDRYRQREYSPEIVIMPFAVSDATEKVEFFNYPNGSYIPKNISSFIGYKWNGEMCTVDTVKLDDFIPHDERITAIKMDIEGSEQAAIRGAERIIKTHKPRMMISLYHKAEDFYRIPLMLKSLVPEYRLAVRHHHDHFKETILYAWI